MGIYNEIFTESRKEQEFAGIKNSPHVGCLVTNSSAGTRVIGLSYGLDDLNLDLLAGFFTAIGVFAEKKIVSVTYEQGYAIWFGKGKELDVILMTKAEREDVTRKKMIEIVNLLESNSHVMAAVEARKGDTRPYTQHTFEIVKRFPFYVIDNDYWDTYHPIVRSTIEEIEQKISWCKGTTHVLINHMLQFFTGKRSITNIVSAAITDDITEEDILAVMDVLYHFRFLDYIPIHSPESTFLVKVPESDCSRLEEIYGHQIAAILQLCDGSRNLLDLSKDSGIQIAPLKFVVKQMVIDNLVRIQKGEKN